MLHFGFLMYLLPFLPLPLHLFFCPFQSYTSAPSYSKESAQAVAIWKGHPFNPTAGREIEKFSGKDSGKGDSDFNDSDSDISGYALKKDLISLMQNGKHPSPLHIFIL